MSSLSVRSSIAGTRIHAGQEHMPGDYPHSAPLTPSTSTQLSLSQAVEARRTEYTRPRETRIRVGTWNVAAHKSTNQDLGRWFVEGKGVSNDLSTENNTGDPATDKQFESFSEQEARHRKKKPTVPVDDPGSESSEDDVGIYALGLQEIVDINSAVEALRPFSDDATPKRFKKSMEDALPQGYKLVAEQQLIGLLLLVYASPEIAPYVHSVSTTSVGTGLMGYMGNKGAVTARLVIGETTRLVFVNSHLSAGTGKAELERRHWDVSQILSRTRFDPITDGLGIVQESGERIGDEDHAFWFGDLNYRLEGIPAEDVRKLLMLHVRDEYDIGRHSYQKINKELYKTDSHASTETLSSTDNDSKSDVKSSLSNPSTRAASLPDSNDPTSLQATLNSLISHDELHQNQRDGKIFPEWKEGPITFLPTYKYDVGSVGVFDTGEKKRGPSWCDRILYRSKKDRLVYAEKQRLVEEARLRDAEMKKRGIDAAAEDESTMFEYDPEQDADEDYVDAQDSEIPPPSAKVADMNDDLELESYESHQRVLSADHKPLDAVFKLVFDAAVPELKSQIQQEVARDLDRAENEGRPVLTVVVDGSLHGDDPNFTGVNFGPVRYHEPKTQTITLANTGRVQSYFGFVSKPQHCDDAQESITTPKWLSINVDIPSEKESTRDRRKSDGAWDAEVDKVFRLEPGDTTTVDLVSYVKDKDILRRFNDGETMEDILVLRVKDGRDHFLPVRGTWQKSVHGRTLDILTRLPEGGIRALQKQKPSGSGEHKRDRSRSAEEDNARPLEAVRYSAPKEILQLINGIESLVERILAEWSMVGPDPSGSVQPPWIAYAGWPFIVDRFTLDSDTRSVLRTDVNEALDSDQELDALLPPSLPPLHRLEALVDVLLDFLGNLEDGILTAELWVNIKKKVFADSRNALPLEDFKAVVLEALTSSQRHSVSFVMITSMLSRIIQEVLSASNGPGVAPADPSPDLPQSPRVTVRRKTLDRDPTIAKKQLMVKNIAAVFADILIRIPGNEPTGASEAHRRQLIEAFIDNGNP